MSQPAVSALAPLPFDLVYEDGEPLESEWHVWAFILLLGLVRRLMEEQERTDFYVGGNMFVYYSVEQARDVAQGRQYFRGPDVFWVGGVKPGRRKAWVAWENEGRLPDVIVELASPSTASVDRNEKKALYARTFRTSEYYLYDPDLRQWEAFRLAGGVYVPMVPDAQGRFWSEQLGAFLGVWHGVYEDMEDDWVRLFRRDGGLVLTGKERAKAAEAEVERLRALVEDRGQG
ncbi:MAG TPA: Uma2 family endonuclease [Thermoanaerobaculia bacterium]|nr:Uma2 family endonuclease [Thermoanaerobaculia bacterium]